MLFTNRYDAAMRLAKLLEKYREQTGVVLAVPRGGVPIGYHIAKHIHYPLELLLTKKIGHPVNEEVAIGAVSMEGYILDERHSLPDWYIQEKVDSIRKSLHEKYTMFMGDHTPESLKGKIVIIVDDGMATGNTILGAIQIIRNQEPAKIVVAVPVAPSESAQRIMQQVDDFVCLEIPAFFLGVGQFYLDFSEVSDEEVKKMLKEKMEEAH